MTKTIKTCDFCGKESNDVISFNFPRKTKIKFYGGLRNCLLGSWNNGIELRNEESKFNT